MNPILGYQDNLKQQYQAWLKENSKYKIRTTKWKVICFLRLVGISVVCGAGGIGIMTLILWGIGVI